MLLNMLEPLRNKPADAMADVLDQWCLQDRGREFIGREIGSVEQLLSGLFGYYLLQVGWSRAFADSIRSSRIRYHVALEDRLPGVGAGNTMIAGSGAWPIATDSVDVVFFPHTLDFASHPQHILREAERVLIPEGRVIILGFNPWGSGGLGRLSGRIGNPAPWRGNFISAKRVIDWLAWLGFDIECQVPTAFLPPLGDAMLRHLQQIETFGGRWLPGLACAYGIRAVKRVSTLKPLKPRWNARSRVLAGQAVEPTARSTASV